MKPRLLWAEADTEFTFIGQRYLAASGFDVVTAADAVSCLNQLKSSIPDVLVLDDDLQWGGVDGILMWLQQEVPTPERPIVIVSGDTSPDVMSVRTGVPTDRCLQKPYRLQSILEAFAGCDDDAAQAGRQMATARGAV